MSAATILGAVSTTIAAGVAGWFGWLARRAHTHGPESVAGGYSKLVADMREEQTRQKARLAELDAKVTLLTAQVSWLINHVPPSKREEFMERFGGPRDHK